MRSLVQRLRASMEGPVAGERGPARTASWVAGRTGEPLVEGVGGVTKRPPGAVGGGMSPSVNRKKGNVFAAPGRSDCVLVDPSKRANSD